MILSVVIPVRNDRLPLIFTIQNILEEIQDINAEIVVVNDSDDDTIEFIRNRTWVRSGQVRIIDAHLRSQWQSRNRGVEEAKGKYIFICDSHIIIGKNSFYKAIQWAEKNKFGILHFALGWLGGTKERDLLYQYSLKMEEKFWGNWTRKKNSDKPFKIPMKGTGFMVEKEKFIKYRGYNKNLGIYGGGEPYINMKFWMMDETVWCHPECYIWHLADKRGYCWNNDDLWRNFLISAYALGGTKWIDKLKKKYEEKCKNNTRYLQTLNNIYQEAKNLAEEDRQFIETHKKYSLDEVLDKKIWEQYN